MEPNEIPQTEDTRIFKTRILVSFACTSAALGIMLNVVTTWVTYYYENVLGLDPGLFFIAFTIYTVWNAFNDLLAGVLTDKVYPFTKKWGKRFPWYIGSAIPVAIFSILLFLPLSTATIGQIGVFLFLAVILIIYDMLVSLWTVSFAAIRSDKFRSSKDRTIVGAWQVALGTIGGVVGAILPGIVLSILGNNYLLMVAIFSIIGLGFVLLSIPGVKDSQVMLDRVQKMFETETAQEKTNIFSDFFSAMKNGFKNPSFLALLLLTMGNSVVGAFFAPSLPYYVRVILAVPEVAVGGTTTMLSIPFVLAGLIFTPLFAWIVNRGHERIFKITIFLVPISIALFFIVNDILLAYIIGAIVGMTTQFFGIALTPVICDLIDEGSVIEGRRIDSTYNAILTFFTRFGALVWAFMIWLLHSVLTDYDPALGANQSAGAKLAIRAQISLIPAFFFLVGAICFIVLWKLNAQRVNQVKLKLQELNI